MAEIEVDQGVAHACHHDVFQHLGTFDEAPGTLQSPAVRANTKKTMCSFWTVFSLISRDASVRLGSGFLWYKNMVLCSSGLQRGHQEIPWEKD